MMLDKPNISMYVPCFRGRFNDHDPKSNDCISVRCEMAAPSSKDLESELTFEELLDLRARQIGALEDRIEGAASKVAYNRAQDKCRWDKMARVRKEPLKVGDTVLLMETREELPAKRRQERRESEVPEAPPQSIQRPEDQAMAETGPETTYELTGQMMDEDQAARQKELDRQERAAREQEIRAEVRRKNLEELHRKEDKGERSVDLKDRLGKSVSRQQEEDPPLLSEAWKNFDRLMRAARGPEGPQQEMRVKLVFADLLTLKGVMKEGFAAARPSDQKIGERLTKVVHKAYGKRLEWKQEAKDLKENQERLDRELDAMKVELEKVWVGNEAIRQVNQTLDKVNEALRAYLQAQQASFQAKEVKWEKRIKELEAKLEQRAPTTLVDWTEVQGFEMKRPPAEEAFKSQKEEEKVDLQGGEDVPLLDKEMLQPQDMHMEGKAKSEESEWQMPSTVALQQARKGLDVTQQAEMVRDEGAMHSRASYTRYLSECCRI
ncbi:hypothetical protein CBR_g31033 [Chara braunii]|uniref:Uncharacterized protein n=1 Tax=Chara braunii TaxID=69332 RepID=A0A388LED0_CHABU|nr:hypothetical protein CBR_g31033 [Chara braunii]|eukprot:GBG80573.1 hypothetical protein CBR_g31033 [Chara braunii]